MNLQRLDKAWKRWLIPDKTGKRGGRPKFKKRGEKPSFSFSRVNHPKAACFLEGSILRIPKIGNIPVIVHRSIPEGFTLKTATVCFKADGVYVSISVEDGTVPEPRPIDKIKSAVGIDLGLKVFLATSEGEFIRVPQVRRKAQNHLARQQRSLSRKKDGSKNRKKQKSRIAKIHQRIARQREKFHYQVAHKLCRGNDLIAVEDLNIRGLARTKLAKSIYDVSWGKFITILETVVVKYGVHLVKVNPHNTTQNCSGCGIKVPKTLSVRLHECPKCSLEMDRDENAAINILNKALNAVGLTVSACGALVSRQATKQELPRGFSRDVGVSLIMNLPTHQPDLNKISSSNQTRIHPRQHSGISCRVDPKMVAVHGTTDVPQCSTAINYSIVALLLDRVPKTYKNSHHKFCQSSKRIVGRPSILLRFFAFQ